MAIDGGPVRRVLIPPSFGGPAGGHKLIIRSELAGDEGIRVSVADRGDGLAPDNLEKVFEPFFTTKVQGMGLGLSA